MDRHPGRTTQRDTVLARHAKIQRTPGPRYSTPIADPSAPAVLDLLVARADELRERLTLHPTPDSAPCRALRRQLAEIDVVLVKLRGGDLPTPVRLARLLRDPPAPGL